MNNTGNNQREDGEDSLRSNNTPPQAGWREWIGLVILGLPTLLLALDFTMLHLALPHLAADLQPSSTQQLWILDIYGFMIAGFLVTMGTLGDRMGRRRLLVIGASLFGASSVLAAFSTSAEMLIVTRALLGITGATLMPSTLALIGNMFKDPKQRAMAIGVWMVCFSAGGVLGPAVGGVLLEYFWWGSVFLLGVPVMVLLLITAPFLLPEYRNRQAGRLDLISVILSLGAILPVIYGLKEIAKDGWQGIPVLTVMAGLIIGWVFLRRQSRMDDPFMDLGLFRNRSFSGALSMLLLGMISIGAFVLLFAQYLQMVKGLSPVEAGLWMIPYAVGSIIGIMIAPIIVRRIPSAYVISVGLVIASIGYMMVILTDPSSGLIIPVLGSILLTFGAGPMQVLTTDLILGSAPPEKAGAAASMSETGGELGMALGIATLGSVGTAVYRRQVEVPANTPPETAEAVRDSLAGATAAAEHLPTELSAELLAPAHEAFILGMKVVGFISVPLLLGLAILALTMLRPVRSIGKVSDVNH